MQSKELTNPIQVIKLNRSKKWEGKKGFYDGHPITSCFKLVGELKDAASNNKIDIYGS